MERPAEPIPCNKADTKTSIPSLFPFCLAQDLHPRSQAQPQSRHRHRLSAAVTRPPGEAAYQ
eukprot:2793203-Pleurochrysis_carterae.AAC.1